MRVCDRDRLQVAGGASGDEPSAGNGEERRVAAGGGARMVPIGGMAGRSGAPYPGISIRSMNSARKAAFTLAAIQ